MGGLRDQAVRLRRKGWLDQELAEEMMLILLQAPDLSPGTTSLDQGQGRDPLTIPERQATDPFGNFDGGDFWVNLVKVNQFNPNPTTVELEDNEGGDDGIRRKRRKKSNTRVTRTVMPGKVVSGAGDTYDVECYPEGLDGETFVARDVKQLQIATDEVIPEGTWGFVWAMVRQKVTRTEHVEYGPGTMGERIVGQNTEVEVLEEKYALQIPVWLT